MKQFEHFNSDCSLKFFVIHQILGTVDKKYLAGTDVFTYIWFPNDKEE
jgi:hypothetical protein